mgnify:CR=1 FL=1
MKVFKRIKWAYVLVSVFFIVIGVLLILNPETSMIMLCRVLGIGAIVFGLVRVLGYFLRELEGVGLQYDFASGVFAVIAGAMVIWRAPEVANIMAVVIGMFILVDCVFKLQVALDSKRMGASSWWVTLLFTCICMVLGCLLIFDTFKGQQVISIMMGVSLVADGLQNLCTVVYAAIFVKEVKTAVHNAAPGALAAGYYEWYSVWDSVAQEGIDQEVLLHAGDAIKTCDSIEELAEVTGVNLKNLKATIEEYNKMCNGSQAGYDWQFTKPAKFLKPILKAPFYAAKHYPSGYGSLGGIQVNENMQVLNNDLDPIPGLYACGTDTATVFADSYCFYHPGSTMSYAINSGRIAGMEAVAYMDSDEFVEPDTYLD